MTVTRSQLLDSVVDLTLINDRDDLMAIDSFNNRSIEYYIIAISIIIV